MMVCGRLGVKYVNMQLAIDSVVAFLVGNPSSLHQL